MTVSKTNEAALVVKLATGAQKHLSGLTQVILGGDTLTPAQVETQLNAFAALRADVVAAQATVKAKVAAEASQAIAMTAFVEAFVAFVKAAFGNSPDVLADFGLAPKKARKPLTAEQLAARAAKAKATRIARGTVGKKKKLAIKGNVTGVTVTPVTSAPVTSAANVAASPPAPAPTEPAPTAPNTATAPTGVSK